MPAVCSTLGARPGAACRKPGGRWPRKGPGPSTQGEDRPAEGRAPMPGASGVSGLRFCPQPGQWKGQHQAWPPPPPRGPAAGRVRVPGWHRRPRQTCAGHGSVLCGRGAHRERPRRGGRVSGERRAGRGAGTAPRRRRGSRGGTVTVAVSSSASPRRRAGDLAARMRARGGRLSSSCPSRRGRAASEDLLLKHTARPQREDGPGI